MERAGVEPALRDCRSRVLPLNERPECLSFLAIWSRPRESNPHLLRTGEPCVPSTPERPCFNLEPRAGVEPAEPLYGRGAWPPPRGNFDLEREAGIEPAFQAWHACALPLSYARLNLVSSTAGTEFPCARSAIASRSIAYFDFVQTRNSGIKKAFRGSAPWKALCAVARLAS